MSQAASERWQSRLLKSCACCGGAQPLSSNTSSRTPVGPGSGGVPSLWNGSAQPDESLVVILIEALRSRPDGGGERAYLHELRLSRPELNSLSEVQVTWLGSHDREQRFLVQPSVAGVSVSLTAAARADVGRIVEAERSIASELQSSANSAEIQVPNDRSRCQTIESDPGAEPKSQDAEGLESVDNEDTEFIQRILKMHREMDMKMRRGPSFCDQALPEFPIYGQGSPLWERCLADDSGESDPEMPELVSTRVRGVCSMTSPAREDSCGLMSTSTDEFDEGSPASSSPVPPIDFGACWGRNALKGALKNLDLDDSPQPRASGDIGPTPL